jgi:parallel beta-helix repeat protein
MDGADHGISVSRRNVTIRNGVVRGFAIDVVLLSTESTVRDMTLVVNDHGVFASKGGTITNNRIMGTGLEDTRGIFVGGFANTVARNLISGTEVAMFLDGGRNSVQNNSIVGTSEHALEVTSAANRITKNTIDGGGIFLTGPGADKNAISHNIVSRSPGFGVYVQGGGASGGPTDNLIEDNTVSYNSSNGIEIDDGTTTRVRGNEVSHNGGHGINSVDVASTISRNTVSFNGFDDNDATPENEGFGILAPASGGGSDNKAFLNLQVPHDCSPLELCTYLDVAGPNDETTVGCNTAVSGFLKLANNLSNCADDGLRVMANNVVIDLNGHHISGSGDGAGISNMGGFDNLTVRNGTIRNFQNGIDSRGTAANIAAGGSFLELDLARNDTGLFLFHTTHTMLFETRVVGNALSGVLALTSAATRVRSNTILGNGTNGIAFSVNSVSDATGNEIAGSGREGIFMEDVGSTWLTGNTVDASGRDGIAVTPIAAGPNLVRENVVTASGRDGISFIGAGDAVDLLDNTSVSNSRYGMWLDGGGHKIVTGNGALDNGYDGIYVAGSDAELTDNVAHRNGFADNTDGGDGFGVGLNVQAVGATSNNTAKGNDDVGQCAPVSACN